MYITYIYTYICVIYINIHIYIYPYTYLYTYVCVYAARKWVWQRCRITLWMPSGIYHCIYVSMYILYLCIHMLAAMYKHTHTHTHVITHNLALSSSFVVSLLPSFCHTQIRSPPTHLSPLPAQWINVRIWLSTFIFLYLSFLFLFDGHHIYIEWSWTRPTPHTLQHTALFLPHAATHCKFLFLFDRHYSQWP